MHRPAAGAPELGYIGHAQHDAAIDTTVPRSLWAFPSKPRKDASGCKNPVEVCYYELWGLGLGRWLFSLIVMAFAALIMWYEPSSPLYEVAITHIAVAGLHLFTPAPFVRQRSPTDPRTPRWYPFFVAASSIMWTAIMAVMIALIADENSDILLNKRGWTRASSNASGAAGSMGNRLIIGAICFDAGALLCNLCKGYFWYRLSHRAFEPRDVREAYMLASKQAKASYNHNDTAVMQ